MKLFVTICICIREPIGFSPLQLKIIIKELHAFYSFISFVLLLDYRSKKVPAQNIQEKSKLKLENPNINCIG